MFFGIKLPTLIGVLWIFHRIRMTLNLALNSSFIICLTQRRDDRRSQFVLQLLLGDLGGVGNFLKVFEKRSIVVETVFGQRYFVDQCVCLDSTAHTNWGQLNLLQTLAKDYTNWTYAVPTFSFLLLADLPPLEHDWAATTCLASSAVFCFSIISNFFRAIISSCMDIWATRSIRDKVCRDIFVAFGDYMAPSSRWARWAISVSPTLQQQCLGVWWKCGVL